jgi:hypothetical protein
MGGDAITEMARQLVRKHPTHPARSLARRLVQEANGAITLEQARYRIRAQFGQSGKRGKPAAKRAARKPGQGVAMPPSKAEKWEPYVLGNHRIVGILSDNPRAVSFRGSVASGGRPFQNRWHRRVDLERRHV